MTDIAACEAEVLRLQRELKEAEKVLHQARMAASPFKLGQIYRREKLVGYGKSARTVVERGQVTGFASAYGDTRPILTMLKKDGSLGERKHAVWRFEDWELEPGESA